MLDISFTYINDETKKMRFKRSAPIRFLIDDHGQKSTGMLVINGTSTFHGHDNRENLSSSGTVNTHAMIQ